MANALNEESVTAQELWEFRQARPFIPFTIRTNGGHDHAVVEPDLFMVSPDGTLAVVVGPPSRVTLIDVANIASVIPA